MLVMLVSSRFRVRRCTFISTTNGKCHTLFAVFLLNIWIVQSCYFVHCLHLPRCRYYTQCHHSMSSLSPLPYLHYLLHHLHRCIIFLFIFRTVLAFIIIVLTSITATIAIAKVFASIYMFFIFRTVLAFIIIVLTSITATIAIAKVFASIYMFFIFRTVLAFIIIVLTSITATIAIAKVFASIYMFFIFITVSFFSSSVFFLLFVITVFILMVLF